MRMAVAGGTGVVGRHVVDVARERGHDVVVLARSAGTDLATGIDPTGSDGPGGLASRLAGVEAVVDTTGVVTQRRAAAEAFFGAVSRALLAAEVTAGVGHHVVLSIVGIDDVATGYYAGKLRQEQVVSEGPVPWSILRATQFHEFAEQALGFARVGPLSLVPRMRTQPVAAREVGEALVELAVAGPGGRVPDLAGPEPQQLVDLARRVSRARGPRRRVLGVPTPGAAGRAMRAGALLPAGPGPRGRVIFEDWLTGG